MASSWLRHVAWMRNESNPPHCPHTRPYVEEGRAKMSGRPIKQRCRRLEGSVTTRFPDFVLPEATQSSRSHHTAFGYTEHAHGRR